MNIRRGGPRETHGRDGFRKLPEILEIMGFARVDQAPKPKASAMISSSSRENEMVMGRQQISQS